MFLEGVSKQKYSSRADVSERGSTNIVGKMFPKGFLNNIVPNGNMFPKEVPNIVGKMFSKGVPTKRKAHTSLYLFKGRFLGLFKAPTRVP